MSGDALSEQQIHFYLYTYTCTLSHFHIVSLLGKLLLLLVISYVLKEYYLVSSITGINHADSNLQNLLLSTNGDAPVLKIGDFGFAR